MSLSELREEAMQIHFETHRNWQRPEKKVEKGLMNELESRRKPSKDNEEPGPSEANKTSKILDRVSVLAAIATIVTFLKDSAELAEFALENTKISFTVGLVLALLLIGDLWPRFREFVGHQFAKFGNRARGWTNKSGVRKPFAILKFLLVASALLLIVAGGLALTTRGVFYIILESSQTESTLASHAGELNHILNEKGSELELRVLSPREGGEYFALATGPYIRKNRAIQDLEHLRDLLGTEVRDDAWVSKTTLSTVNVALRRGVK